MVVDGVVEPLPVLTLVDGALEVKVVDATVDVNETFELLSPGSGERVEVKRPAASRKVAKTLVDDSVVTPPSALFVVVGRTLVAVVPGSCPVGGPRVAIPRFRPGCRC